MKLCSQGGSQEGTRPAPGAQTTMTVRSFVKLSALCRSNAFILPKLMRQVPVLPHTHFTGEETEAWESQ